MKYLLIYFTLLMFVAGCQTGTGFDTPPSLPPSAVSTGQPSITLIPPNSSLDHLTQVIIADLAHRLELDPQLITVIDAQPVTWPDAGLGCPKRGVMYIQKLTDGYIVQLEANGQRYEYHTDTDQNIVLCEPNSPENNSLKDTDKSVQDGGPNETKDRDVIIVTPTR